MQDTVTILFKKSRVIFLNCGLVEILPEYIFIFLLEGLNEVEYLLEAGPLRSVPLHAVYDQVPKEGHFGFLQGQFFLLIANLIYQVEHILAVPGYLLVEEFPQNSAVTVNVRGLIVGFASHDLRRHPKYKVK